VGRAVSRENDETREGDAPKMSWPFSRTVGHLRIEPFFSYSFSPAFYFILFYRFISFSLPPLLMFFNSFSLYNLSSSSSFRSFHPAIWGPAASNWYPGALLFISALDIYPIWIVFVLFCLFLNFLLWYPFIFSSLLVRFFFFLFSV
jgi:hypothetical protein